MGIKDRIIKKTSELFIDHGIKNISVDEIALSLGISKRTIYEKFKDKEDILIQCLKMFNEQKKKAFLESDKKSNNIIELFLNMWKYSETVDRIPSVKFFEDIEKYYPRVKQQISEQKQKNFELIKIYLQKGIGEGVIRDNLNVEIAAFIVHDTYTYIFMRASQFNSHPFTLQELSYTMIINFIRGISTDKGIKIIDNYLKDNPYKQ